jgi:hypothetical protein
MLSDPDYINEKILSYIKQQEKLMADTKRTYTYAASYEDFVKMINSSTSADQLKQMRLVNFEIVFFCFLLLYYFVLFLFGTFLVS